MNDQKSYKIHAYSITIDSYQTHSVAMIQVRYGYASNTETKSK